MTKLVSFLARIKSYSEQTSNNYETRFVMTRKTNGDRYRSDIFSWKSDVLKTSMKPSKKALLLRLIFA